MEHVVRKNINRGYMKLIVWHVAKALYVMTCKMFREFPYELKRIASQIKRHDGGWDDSFVVRESNAAYDVQPS